MLLDLGGGPFVAAVGGLVVVLGLVLGWVAGKAWVAVALGPAGIGGRRALQEGFLQ